MLNMTSHIIDDTGHILPNSYHLVDSDAVQIQGDVLLRADQLELLPQITGKKGLLIDVDHSPETTTLPLQELDLIAIEFASFVDGRGFSFATLLRRQGFTGELRAVGDIFKDTLCYLKRCGFNSFAIKADKDITDAALGLRDFSYGYQKTTRDGSSHYQIGHQQSTRNCT